MKLLHVGNDRELAYRLAGALQRAGREVTVAWFGRVSDARRWVCDNPDFGALLIEDHIHNHGCAAFIREVRGLGLTAPVIAVSMKSADPPIAELRAGADDYVVNGPSLVPDLVGVIGRGLHRAKGLAAKRPMRCLYLGDSALARESLRDGPYSIEIVEAGNATATGVDVLSPGQKFPFDVVLAEHGRPGVDIFAILKDMAARRLQVPVVFVVEWDEELIVPALRMGAVDYVLKTRAAFEALRFRIDRIRSGSILLKEFGDLLQQQSQLRASLQSATTAHAALELQLTDAETTGRDAAERHAAMTKAVAELREQQSQDQDALARTTEAHSALAQQLKDATAALDQARRQQASDAAAAERLAHREAELSARLDEEAAARSALQHELAQSERRALEEREAAARNGSAQRAEFEARLAQESAARETIQRQLHDVSTAFDQTRRARTVDAAAAAERLTQCELELSEAIAETAAVRDAFERRLGEAKADLQEAEERAKADRQALLHGAAQRQTELETRVERETTRRSALEDALRDAEAVIAETKAAVDALKRRSAELEAALQQSEQRARADREAAVLAVSKREAEIEVRLAEDASVRHALEQHVSATEDSLREAIERHASEMAAASERLAADHAQHAAALAQNAGVRSALEQELNDISVELAQAKEARTADSRKAAKRLAQREAELKSVIDDLGAKLAAIEHRLTASEAALQQAEERASHERRTAANEASRQAAEFESRLQRETAARQALEQQLAASEATLRDAADQHATEVAQSATRLAEMAKARELLEQQVRDVSTALEDARHARILEAAEADEQLRRRDAELTSALTAYRAEYEAKLAEMATARDTFERQLKDASLALEETKKALDKSTAMRERLEALVSERDARLKEQAASHAASQEALQTGAAHRIASLRRQLDETVARQRSEFERLPSSMLRSARDGKIEQVNDAMAAMLGHRTPDEVRELDFANGVFESPGEWRSLIDRCVETGATQSLETTWKRKDGVRLAVRVLAVASPSGHVDVVVEDFTKYRELEEKLRRSERMEAVGRLASEVAATCDSLLRDVSQDGHAWLAAIGDDSKVRQQGELLLNDVTRAASYLRQLDAYGRKQADSLEPVDLARALRNVTPVLKRVAGNDIEFVLPKRTSPINIDVELDRVERIFVNVAAYSRERMPFGGRLMFEFGDVMVGGDGAADHPDVRPGPHVLITVTAVRYAVWSDAARTLPRVSHATSAAESPDRVGVDLGAIQALIRGCGGRLWLTAEPPGDMVLKIHLPRLMPDLAAVRRTKVPHPMRRWLHAGR